MEASRVGLLAIVLVAGCARHPVVPGGEEGEGCVADNGGYFSLTLNRDVDLLFVIDNSGSMAEEQERLAADIDSLLSVLEETHVDASYRIGITTTDNGNPWCQGTTPEAGALQLSSCRERLDDFVFPGTDVGPPADWACTNVCALDNIEILPTVTEGDLDPAPRLWVENTEGTTNLPPDVSMAEALACLLPQGINGCGFESHLESMYKALRRAQDESEASHGFSRGRSILAVVFVTDEADCSYRNEHESIFLPDGDRVFWSDPEAEVPTSAVCWNAGVACTGGPGTYDECHAEDKAEDGSPTSPDDAVLHPIGRYIDLLQELEDDKKQYHPALEVLVAVIGGVPEGYASGEKLLYQDSEDQVFQGDYGIGPGCEATAIRAVPPVRLRELAEAFAIEDERNLHSVCAESYAESLAAIGRAIADHVMPSCYAACVGDSDCDPDNGLTPECHLIQEAPTETWPVTTAIQPCDVDLETGTWDFPSPEDDACFRMLIENDTPTELDDMSNRCKDEGWNLELVIERRPAKPAPPGTIVRADCGLSHHPREDCPGLWRDEDGQG